MTTTTTTMPSDTHELASAPVALALQRAGWKQVDAAPWCWVRGGEALPWQEALALSVAPPAAAAEAEKPKGRIERVADVVKACGDVAVRVLSSKAVMTAGPILAGVVVDALPLLIPAAQLLPAPYGTFFGGVAGSFGRVLASHLQARRK